MRLPETHGYVYGLIDPRTPHVIEYIGWSFRSAPASLLSKSYTPHSTSRCAALQPWLLDLQSQGLRVWLVLIDYRTATTEEELDALETKWIEHYKRLGHPLRNKAKARRLWGRVLTADDCGSRLGVGDQIAMFGPDEYLLVQPDWNGDPTDK